MRGKLRLKLKKNENSDNAMDFDNLLVIHLVTPKITFILKELGASLYTTALLLKESHCASD